MNYGDLIARVADWLDDTQSEYSAQIPVFISQAEERFNYGSGRGGIGTNPLRVREMETKVTLTPTGGVYTLPVDYLEWRRVTALTSPRRNLEFVTSDHLDWRYPHRGAGYPSVFTIEGDNLTVMPTTSSDIELLYYARIPALSAPTSTNWLLDKHPSAYLYAALLEAAFLGIRAEADPVALASNLAAIVSGIETSDRGARWTRGSARVKGATP